MNNYHIPSLEDPLQEFYKLREERRKRMKPLEGRAEEIHQSLLPEIRSLFGGQDFGGQAFSLSGLGSIGGIVKPAQNDPGLCPLVDQPVANLALSYLMAVSGTFQAWAVKNGARPVEFLKSALSHEYGHIWFDSSLRNQFKYAPLDFNELKKRCIADNSNSEAFAFWTGDHLSQTKTPRTIMKSYNGDFDPYLIVKGYNALTKFSSKKGARETVKRVFDILE